MSAEKSPDPKGDAAPGAPSAEERISYREYLRRLPKAELHCHFVATIQPSTLVELARAHGVALPTYDTDALFDYDNIVDFLAVFKAAGEVFVDKGVVERVAYESVGHAARTGNLRYREYFVNPDTFRFGYRELLDGMVAGLQAAEADFGVGFGIIPAIARHLTPEVGVELVEKVLDDGRPEVLGIGQDYLAPDDSESPHLFAAAYRLAERHGLRRTAHVGEIPGSSAAEVVVAIDELHCQRVDHGYHILSDPAVVERAVQLKIPFTCTPSSTRVLSGWEFGPSHPIASMVRQGLNVTIATDDPTFFSADIGREFAEVLPAFGFGPDVARRLALAAIDAAWCPPAARVALRAGFEEEVAHLDALLDPASVREDLQASAAG
ncbi:MAG: adenosine deaminase [Acidobacteriota bacterium]|nr:adenosine deaminase [Acidobacteriota bacterium]